MRYGMNLLLWTDTVNEAVRPILEQVKGLGYDAVEVPVFEIDVEKYGQFGKWCDAAGLARTGVTVRGTGDNPASGEASVRAKGVAANKAVLDCCQAAGCESLVGPYHSALGWFSGKGPTADEWKWAVQSMCQVAEHAEKCKVKLGLEAVNRFECYLMNTMADGARFCRDVNHPYCGLMYDTFHSHIEEKSTPAAIRAAKDFLVHVHISENDRSTPGQGNIRWAENFDTLAEIGYDNLLVVEAFGLALEKLVPATKIWRRMYQDETQLAGDALRFMKAEVGKRQK